jgi:copper chaperone CopZ
MIRTRMENLTNLGAALLVSCICICIAPALSGCRQEAGGPAPAPAAAADAAQTTVLHFAVEGMHCNGCVMAITDTVSRLEGVTACEVSLDEKSAAVTVNDPALAAKIIEEISALGYTAELAGG